MNTLYSLMQYPASKKYFPHQRDLFCLRFSIYNGTFMNGMMRRRIPTSSCDMINYM
jgi:hypothetical protein